ncbi:hypothetical protein EG329_004907 [Mollisiaceae sp. DMI_Dod_QoI]|nr:hypothetical protein EG329_004907 [Helotiales sp. DMI_Dod_QoI]
MVDADLEKGPSAGRHDHFTLTSPPEAYTPNANNTETNFASSLQDMQAQPPQLRPRHTYSTPTTAEHENPTEVETATAASNVDHDNLQGETRLYMGQARLGRLETGGRWAGMLRSLHQSFASDPNPELEQIKKQRGYHRIKSNKLETHVEGIPRFAAFQNSNNSFSIIRKFGDQTFRLLIMKEIELCQITEKLHILDKEDEADERLQYRLTSIENNPGWDQSQRKLLQEYEEKVLSYYTLAEKFIKMNSLDRAAERHHQSVLDWAIDNPPLEGDEDSFLFDPTDFVYARKSSGSGKDPASRIEEAIESYLQSNPTSFFHVRPQPLLSYVVKRVHPPMQTKNNVFQKFVIGEKERQKTDNASIVHLSSTNIGVLARLLSALLGYGVLITSVFLLFLTDFSQGKKAGVVGVFVLLFLIVMSMVTDVTPHDLFMVLLGFSAVLVTLLSNVNQSVTVPSST